MVAEFKRLQMMNVRKTVGVIMLNTRGRLDKQS